MLFVYVLFICNDVLTTIYDIRDLRFTRFTIYESFDLQDLRFTRFTVIDLRDLRNLRILRFTIYIFWIYFLGFYYLRFAIDKLRFTIYNLRFTIYYLRFEIYEYETKCFTMANLVPGRHIVRKGRLSWIVNWP